jgi:hypothetical protein
MSIVNQYKCNNEECAFRTTREMCFPVWKSSVSKEDANLTLVEKREKYLAGYINRQYCTVCNAIRPYLQGSEMCLICNTEGLYIKDGSICPKCKIGVINEIEGKSIHFQMKTVRSINPQSKTAKQLSLKGKNLLIKYLENIGLN